MPDPKAAELTSLMLKLEHEMEMVRVSYTWFRAGEENFLEQHLSELIIAASTAIHIVRGGKITL